MATDIQQLLHAGESETLEFKQSVGEIREIIETAGGFANGQGGTIIIGVTSTGKVLGVDIGKDTLESLANSIQQQTDPKVFPSMRVAEVEGKNIVISMAAEIVPTQIERQERWEYPLEALREAIINATCHRDYRDSGNVQVRIFDDRVEVWSPGLLPEGITIKDLYRTHNSRPRNHRIARAFFLIRYIEYWGTGTLRMINLCRDAGLPAPEFTEVSGAVVVTFRKAKPTKKYHEGPEQIQRQKQAIEYVRERGKITTQGYAQLLGVSARTAHRDLTALTEKGILRRVGKGKSVHFELT
jgi:predicted HTH transcriptional regulator